MYTFYNNIALFISAKSYFRVPVGPRRTKVIPCCGFGLAIPSAIRLIEHASRLEIAVSSGV